MGEYEVNEEEEMEDELQVDAGSSSVGLLDKDGQKPSLSKMLHAGSDDNDDDDDKDDASQSDSDAGTNSSTPKKGKKRSRDSKSSKHKKDKNERKEGRDKSQSASPNKGALSEEKATEAFMFLT